MHTRSKIVVPCDGRVGVLIPSLCVNNSWTLIFKMRRPLFGFSNIFPWINVSGDFHAFSFLENASLAFRPHSRRRIGCDTLLHCQPPRPLPLCSHRSSLPNLPLCASKVVDLSQGAIDPTSRVADYLLFQDPFFIFYLLCSLL